VPTTAARELEELMNGRPDSNGKLEGRQRLGTTAWVWYLITGTVLAVTRVALLVWLNHQRASGSATETVYFMGRWLYPEAVVSIPWRHLAAVYGTDYYLAWVPLVMVGSFLLATPILLVSRLRRRTSW
jgi:hypothetical protein